MKTDIAAGLNPLFIGSRHQLSHADMRGADLSLNPLFIGSRHQPWGAAILDHKTGS